MSKDIEELNINIQTCVDNFWFELDEKDKIIAQLNREIFERDRAIAKLEKELTEKEEAIAKLKTEYHELNMARLNIKTDKWLAEASLRKAIANLEIINQSLTKDVEIRDKEIETLKQELNQLKLTQSRENNL